jgi:hypothetical protein
MFILKRRFLMMNKKIIAILMVAMAVTGLFADECYDNDGRRVRCHRGIVRDVAEGTVDTAGDVVEGTLGSGSILNPGNWGSEGHRRRQEAREERRERRYRD